MTVCLLVWNERTKWMSFQVCVRAHVLYVSGILNNSERNRSLQIILIFCTHCFYWSIHMSFVISAVICLAPLNKERYEDLYSLTLEKRFHIKANMICNYNSKVRHCNSWGYCNQNFFTGDYLFTLGRQVAPKISLFFFFFNFHTCWRLNTKLYSVLSPGFFLGESQCPFCRIIGAL